MPYNSLSKIFVIHTTYLLFLCNQASGQTGAIFLFIDSNTIIGKIEQNRVYTSETHIAYNLGGNTIYAGDTASKETMEMLVDVKDFFSKKTGVIYRKTPKDVQYICRNAELFLGDYPINTAYERLLYLEKENDSLIEVYNGISEANIGFIEGKNPAPAEIIIACHLYIQHYNIDKEVEKNMAGIDSEEILSAGGSIRPRYGYNPYFEWVWDGTVLQPALGNRPEDTWRFDGKYIEPVWGSNTKSEWQWDGAIFKPSWDQTADNQWIWEDNILKPFWDNNPDKTYILEDTIIRPRWSFDATYQWEITGTMPLPLIALVILGIADR